MPSTKYLRSRLNGVAAGAALQAIAMAGLDKLSTPTKFQGKSSPPRAPRKAQRRRMLGPLTSSRKAKIMKAMASVKKPYIRAFKSNTKGYYSGRYRKRKVGNRNQSYRKGVVYQLEDGGVRTDTESVYVGVCSSPWIGVIQQAAACITKELFRLAGRTVNNWVEKADYTACTLKTKYYLSSANIGTPFVGAIGVPDAATYQQVSEYLATQMNADLALATVQPLVYTAFRMELQDGAVEINAEDRLSIFIRRTDSVAGTFYGRFSIGLTKVIVFSF